MYTLEAQLLQDTAPDYYLDAGSSTSIGSSPYCSTFLIPNLMHKFHWVGLMQQEVINVNKKV